MARNATIRKNKRENEKAKRRSARRIAARSVINDPNASFEDKMQAHKKMQGAFSSRQERRCPVTGRKRGFYRSIGLCRHFIRKVGMELCQIPGLIKSSW